MLSIRGVYADRYGDKTGGPGKGMPAFESILRQTSQAVAPPIYYNIQSRRT
jgi:hypothetical protein